MSRFICGLQPVREAIRARGPELEKVLVERGAGDEAQLDALARFASDHGVLVVRVTRTELDRLSRGARHQGAVAWAPELRLVSLDDVRTGPEALVVALDELQDPQNFGAIVRSSVALGATAILWPEHRSAPLSAAMFRASAGAVEHATLCRVPSLNEALATLKAAGLTVVGLDMQGKETIDSVPLTGGVVLVIGAEGKGLRRPVKQACDRLARLPMGGTIASLNASVATGIALYEVARQRAGAATPPDGRARAASLSRARTPMPRRFPWRLFLFAFFGWTFDFYDLVLLGFVKDPIAHDLHLTPSVEAWVLGVALSTSGIGGIVSGALADRFGKRTLLAATVALYSLGSLVSGLAPTLGVFLVGRALVGLGVGGEWAIGHGMLAEAVDPAKRGRASAALQSGEPVGVALAAVAGFLVLPHVGWRWLMIGSSATAILAMVARRSMHLPNEPASAKPPTLRDLRRAGLGSTLAPRVAPRRLQAGDVLDLLHLAPELPREGDGAESWALARMDADRASRAARGDAHLRTGGGSRRAAPGVHRLLALDGVRGCAARLRVAVARRAPGALLGRHAVAGHRLGVHRGLRRAPRGAVPDGGALDRDGDDVQLRPRRAAPRARDRASSGGRARPRGGALGPPHARPRDGERGCGRSRRRAGSRSLVLARRAMPPKGLGVAQRG